MTNYSVAAGKVAKHGLTLGVASEDVITFAKDCETVEVLNRGSTNPIFFTVDGSTATVEGDNTYIVLAGQSLEVDVPTAGNTVVHVIAASAVLYSVQGQ